MTAMTTEDPVVFEDPKVSKGKKLIGRQTPTFEISNEEYSGYSVYDEVIHDFLLKCGIFLFIWQRKLLDKWLTKGPDGWLYAVLALSVPRRNGKSELIIAYIFVKTILYGERTAYTSYHAASMNAVFKRIQQLIQAPNKYGKFLRTFFDLPFRKNNIFSGPGILTGKGGETIVSKSGGVCVFWTRGGGAGRGDGFDNMIFDEAQELDAKEVAALVPTADAQNPQIIYSGTPESIISNSVIFGQLRNDIIAGVYQNSYYAEWASNKIERKQNKRAWYNSNPSLGLMSTGRGGLSEKTIQSKFILSDEQFAVEILGYWKKQTASAIIDINTWKALDSEEPEPTPTEKIALGVRFSLDGDSFSVSVASQDINRKTFVEVLADGRTDQPVKDNIDEETGEHTTYISWEDYFEQVVIPIIKNRKCVSVLVDGKPHIAELQILLAKHRLWDTSKVSYKQNKIMFAKTQDIVSANSFFVDSIKKEDLTHSKDDILSRAVQDAGRREIRGNTGGFGFLSNSGIVDMTILESTVLAFYAVSVSSIRKANNENPIKQQSIGSRLGGSRNSLRRTRKDL